MLDAVLIGLGGLYLWVLASQLHTPVIYPVQKWLRTGWRRPLIECPWCFSWWSSVVITLVYHHARLDPIETPLTILAASAVGGYIGSLTPGIEDEDESGAYL